MNKNKCNSICEKLGLTFEKVKQDGKTTYFIKKNETRINRSNTVKDAYNFLIDLQIKMEQNPDFDVVDFVVGNKIHKELDDIVTGIDISSGDDKSVVQIGELKDTGLLEYSELPIDFDEEKESEGIENLEESDVSEIEEESDKIIKDSGITSGLEKDDDYEDWRDFEDELFEGY